MLIRHAEKPAKDGAPFGVNRKGLRSKEALAVRGWQRAGALATLFAPVSASVSSYATVSVCVETTASQRQSTPAANDHAAGRQAGNQNQLRFSKG
jgi:hypothetical protein